MKGGGLAYSPCKYIIKKYIFSTDPGLCINIITEGGGENEVYIRNGNVQIFPQETLWSEFLFEKQG